MAFWSKWFKKDKGEREDPNLPTPISLESSAPEERHLEAHPASASARVHQRREQHYVFAHRMLHQFVLSGPPELLAFLRSAAAEPWIRSMWDDIGADAEDRRTVSAEEVSVSARTLAGRDGCLIRLPEPVATPEAYFVAILPGTESEPEPRYFVLEYTGMENPTDESHDGQLGPRAVLCEWLAGGKRRNHNLIVASPDERSFFQAIATQLNEEERRRQLGARPVDAPTWDMRVDNDPLWTMFSDRAYRLQCCLFAFHLLPMRLAQETNWHPLDDVDVATRHVLALWKEAADACARAQLPLLTSTPSTRLVEVAGRRHVLVEMPEPLSPPEPAFILLPANSGEPVLLLEIVNARTQEAVLTHISREQHGIAHGVKSIDEHAFLQAAYRHLSVLPSEDEVPGGIILQHLFSYREIYEQIEQIGGVPR